MRLSQLAIFAVISLSFTQSILAGQLQGHIIGISDGDTVTLLSENTQYKIRLASIDAPEKKQDFGARSKQELSDCAFDKEVTIEGNKKDRYGRLVGKVIANGVDCNLRQVRNGMAWHYKQYQNEQTAEERMLYSNAEIVARNSGTGLWAQINPIPPWDFRKYVKTRRADALVKQ